LQVKRPRSVGRPGRCRHSGAHTARPLGVHRQMPRSRKSVPAGSTAFAMSRASRNSWHVALALSRLIRNVVVVVVTATRRGFLGSGVRFDCANLRADRFRQASSLREKHGAYIATANGLQKIKRDARREGECVALEELAVVAQVERDDERRKEIVHVLQFQKGAGASLGGAA
jgi:hypothetical protein